MLTIFKQQTISRDTIIYDVTKILRCMFHLSLIFPFKIGMRRNVVFYNTDHSIFISIRCLQMKNVSVYAYNMVRCIDRQIFVDSLEIWIIGFSSSKINASRIIRLHADIFIVLLETRTS